MPFVDDSHIPVGESRAIEAVGRKKGDQMWGREDPCKEGGWAAFTTDPVRKDLAWCVRWHPDHGRSVILLRDEDSSGMHMSWWGPALLFRSGGYWWDGSTWYRPSQVWDRASEDYVRRPVPAATTITAADLLAAGDADAGRGRVLRIEEVDVDAPLGGRWLDDLAAWAAHREAPDSLSGCVVRVTAPELSADAMVGIGEMAEIADIVASTLRAYLSRGEGEIPPPQAVVAGRSVWARPVAEEWAEQRRRSGEGTAETMSTVHNGSSVPVGVADLWQWLSRVFFMDLWDRPDRRRRWALRWRTQAAVRDVADSLGWSAAASLDRMIPTHDLAVTLRHAVLNGLSEGQKLGKTLGDSPESINFYGVAPPVARMLDWLIRHEPSSAVFAIGEIVGEAERDLGIPRDVTVHSLHTALALDGKLEEGGYVEFFDRILLPDKST
ncbi:MerR family transcriptional regulator [Rugosimonospora africana]|uniref:Uncharacterized protein n=1 Tax=Rugosimonospora africana TaxID=556532 RepID=A0A8J3QZA1_9ACTN|nr:hypothetical protein [Rugosimonospora africana]GIH18974.1 hypothetical protein Raf01_71460 [Rugosimonospora africana]